MKTTRGKSQQASALVMTIVTCVLVGTVLSSYLMLVTHRNLGAMRALAWNSAIPVLEVGIEEALTHLNTDAKDPTANLWAEDQVNGKPVYWKHRTLPDGSYF